MISTAMPYKIVFDHPLFKLETAPHNGRPHIRLNTPDWVNVLPITDDGMAVLVRQPRFGIASETLEVPGGLVDPGEAPLEAARRELREETGYGEGTWESLGFVHPNPAIQNNTTHLFLARGIKSLGPQRLDDSEDISVELHAIDSLAGLVSSHRISHALAVVTIQRFLLQGT